MGADRARVSYDPSRHWRGVVKQQGRVTLEADCNEAATIAAEEDREQLLDVVGPSGTPNNGYEVTAVAEGEGTVGDLTVGEETLEGTLYVGGERMVLEGKLDYAAQPDWIDTANDPLWVPPTQPTEDLDEAVYLLLREQEVGAIEDPALLDVALGGPDTSARLRILQRVVRQRPAGTSCTSALEALERRWQTLGLNFDPATMRLQSGAKLQVAFNPPPEAAPPCQPVAQGGYLGAENQLIRVQVASVDEHGRPTLVWGFDNAYFMYRIEAHPIVDEAADTTILTLANIPVDAFHQPKLNQTVEVLEAAARLTPEDYIAANCGIVTTVSVAYDADTRKLTIAKALPTSTTESPLLFLRVWEDTIAYTAPTELGNTGLTVTLSNEGGYHVGDYWTFAVRPGTPSSVSPVYPQRILEAPQPPDGPRMWACQLAVVAWEEGKATVTDCREKFENLVELSEHVGGCCTIDVTPADVDGGASLQALIDRYRNKGPTTICLDNGEYVLPAPLVLEAGHSDLTIQACQSGVILQAHESESGLAPESFLLGLILMEEPTNVTLRGLELRLPNVRFHFDADAIGGTPEEVHEALESYGRELALSFGVYIGGGSNVRIEQCNFGCGRVTTNVFGAAVFGIGEIEGLELLDCRFTAPEPKTVPFGQRTGKVGSGVEQVRFGYLQLPTRSLPRSFARFKAEAVQAPEQRLAAAVEQPPAQAGLETNVPSTAKTKEQEPATEMLLGSLADGAFERNLFDGLTVPALVVGRLGTNRFQDNIVRACYGGFWLISLEDAATLLVLDRMQADDPAMTNAIANQGLGALSDPVLMLATVLGRIMPLTPPSSQAAGTVGAIAAPTDEQLAKALSQFTRLYSETPQASEAGTSATVEATATEPATPATEPSTEAATPGAAGATDPAQPPASGAPDAPTAQVAELADKPATAEERELPTALVEAFKHPGFAAAADAVPAADPGTALIARLSITANQLDAVLADADSGAALLVMIADTTKAASLIAAANRVRSRVADGATVNLYALHACSLTGNIISNEAGLKTSVSLVIRVERETETPAYSLAGNVLIGVAPPANQPPPLDELTPFNTVVPYTG